jgi:histidinol-phosphatase (PHP family)
MSMDVDDRGDASAFLWETHGIHSGTSVDHVKHGIDSLDAVADEALSRGYPGITFIIHTPRLTRVRYQTERSTDIKFIRGDRAYSGYPELMTRMRERYRGRLAIRYGIELEWLPGELGLSWNRSKVFQCRGADFVIGSVHFSREGIPYDGSPEESAALLELRGGAEAYWLGYLDEMIEMVEEYRDLIHVVGHLDLPKLHVPLPESMLDLDSSSGLPARRARFLLELIRESGLALDLNLAGLRKGCGIYPDGRLLAAAYRLGVPVTVGTDAHALAELGLGYDEGVSAMKAAGYSWYLGFSGGVPEKRPIDDRPGLKAPFRILNAGFGMLGQRIGRDKRLAAAGLSFGGVYRGLASIFPESASLGASDAIRLRQGARFVTMGEAPLASATASRRHLFSLHADRPGTLAILFNTLASEEINVGTAYLESRGDGTATACLTVEAPDAKILDALEFIRGTAAERFFELALRDGPIMPSYRRKGPWLLELDGVELPIPLSERMILTVHDNKPGTLLILLSALSSRNINIHDLQLGERGNRGYAAIGVEGQDGDMELVLSRLGGNFHEATLIRSEHFLRA